MLPELKGQVGELLIGGPGVAIGYMNDTKKNEESFPVINGKKYFRTGDIAYIHEVSIFYF